jgi:hypothetical protein
MGGSTISVDKRWRPYWPPACIWVDTAPPSLSASITIGPGPKTMRKARTCFAKSGEPVTLATHTLGGCGQSFELRFRQAHRGHPLGFIRGGCG